MNNADQIKIDVLPALADNYMYLIRAGEQLALVDPSDARVALAAVERANGALTHILVTHHHYDHVAGLAAVKAATGAQVFGARDPRIPGVDVVVSEGNTIPLAAVAFQVLATPGHSDRDLTFALERPGEPAALFCGDTLFIGGCGRVLEGDYGQLWQSLQQLALWPDDTNIYCGHEYTEDNLRFAVQHDPGNRVFRKRLHEVTAMRTQGSPTVPGRLGTEKIGNPFLLCPDLEAFRACRAAKDRF